LLPTNATYKTVIWSSSDPTVASVNNGVVKALREGTTTITAQAHNGTKGECEVTVANSDVNMTDAHLNIDVTIFPNPFTGDVRIVLSDVEALHAAFLRVFDATGAIVHTQILANPDETLRLQHLPAGVYIFAIEIDGKMKTMRMVKQ